MDAQEIQNLIAFGALLITVIGSILGLFVSVAVFCIKFALREYGFKRDYKHLLRDYQQMSENMKNILDEMDDRFDLLDDKIDALEKELVEIKSIIHLKLHK